MSNPYYSKEVQIEILDEVARNQGTTHNVDITDPVRMWNYQFLIDMGAIETLTTGSRDFNTPCGEKLLDIGKALRSELYEKLILEHKQRRMDRYTMWTFWIVLAGFFAALVTLFRCC